MITDSKPGKDLLSMILFLKDRKSLTAEYEKLHKTEKDVDAGFKRLELERKQLKIDLAGLKALQDVAEKEAEKTRAEARDTLADAVRFKRESEIANAAEQDDLEKSKASLAAREEVIEERDVIAHREHQAAMEMQAEAEKKLSGAKKLEEHYKDVIAGLKGEL